MRCPFCNHTETQVKDSRPTEDHLSIKRRRQCPECGSRFTTFERVQLRELIVLKKDGRKALFDREKLVRSLKLALRKRPVDFEQIERIVSGITRQLETLGEVEIPSKFIGQKVMEALLNLDIVAYIRYASVYEDFKNPADFERFVDNIRKEKRSTGVVHGG